MLQGCVSHQQRNPFTNKTLKKDAERFGQKKSGRKKLVKIQGVAVEMQKDLESKDAKIKSETEMSNIFTALCNSF